MAGGKKSAAGSNSDVDGTDAAAAASDKAIADYIQNLQDETAALTLSKEKLEEYRAEKAAATAAGIALSDMTDEDIQAIDAATAAYDKQKTAIEERKKEQQKQIQMAAQMEAEISSALANIATNYKNFGQAITQVLDQIAKKLLEDQVTTPFVALLARRSVHQQQAMPVRQLHQHPYSPVSVRC